MVLPLRVIYKLAAGRSLSYLAYADYLCLIEESQKDIKSLIAILEEYLTWSKLAMKPAKCTLAQPVYHVLTIRNIIMFSPSIGGAPVKALKWEDHYDK